MNRPSGLLTPQVDPAALFLLAREVVRAAGEESALKRAKRFEGIAADMKRAGVDGTAYEQASSAIVEAVEIARAVELDNEQAAA